MESPSPTGTTLGGPQKKTPAAKPKRSTRNQNPVLDSPDSPIDPPKPPRKKKEEKPPPPPPSFGPESPRKTSKTTISDGKMEDTAPNVDTRTHTPSTPLRRAEKSTLSIFNSIYADSPIVPHNVPPTQDAIRAHMLLLGKTLEDPSLLEKWEIQFHSTLGKQKTLQAIRSHWKIVPTNLIKGLISGVWTIYVMDDFARNRILKGGYQSSVLTVVTRGSKIFRYSFRTSQWYLPVHTIAKALRKEGVAVLRVTNGLINNSVLDGSYNILATSFHKDRSITFLLKEEKIVLRNQEGLDLQRKKSKLAQKKLANNG
eukprot:TRINITY_DN604_c0_g1_i1.p1 TRINITY_DN604_c0_g1~~TRINITY_DN604_c0_g1_i1.p1  ORF type:complete len:313 (+),score=35.53 TRINITY_DN604_c0_g1_i1:1198-2136(+)